MGTKARRVSSEGPKAHRMSSAEVPQACPYAELLLFPAPPYVAAGRGISFREQQASACLINGLSGAAGTHADGSCRNQSGAGRRGSISDRAARQRLELWSC